MTDAELGRAVKLKRLELGLSQSALAKKARVSNTSVCSIETAKRKSLPKTRMALAVALGVEPEKWI